MDVSFLVHVDRWSSRMYPIGKPGLTWWSSIVPLSIAGLAVSLGLAGRLERPGVEETGGPRLEVEKLVDHLGVVAPGSKLKAEFHFRNIGGGRLDLFDLKTSCGCAPATLSASSLGPQETATLGVAMTAPRHSGQVRHTVSVSSNDPEHSWVTLEIRADAQWPVEASPASVCFSSMLRDDTEQAELELLSPNATSFDVVSIESSVPWISVARIARDGRRHRFMVRIRPPFLSPFSEWIRFSTTSAKRPTIVVPITGEAVAPQRVSPRQVLLGNMSGGSTKSVTLVVAQPTAGAVLIDSIRGKDERERVAWAVTDWETDRIASDRSRLRLEIRVPRVAGYHRASLRLVVGDAHESLEVPVSCFVASAEPARKGSL